MLLVIWVPNLLAAQRIAFFDENVYMLYAIEMAQNFRFLLSFYSSESSKFSSIPFLICTFWEVKVLPKSCDGARLAVCPPFR